MSFARSTFSPHLALYLAQRGLFSLFFFTLFGCCRLQSATNYRPIDAICFHHCHHHHHFWSPPRLHTHPTKRGHVCCDFCPHILQSHSLLRIGRKPFLSSKDCFLIKTNPNNAIDRQKRKLACVALAACLASVHRFWSKLGLARSRPTQRGPPLALRTNAKAFSVCCMPQTPFTRFEPLPLPVTVFHISSQCSLSAHK